MDSLDQSRSELKKWASPWSGKGTGGAVMQDTGEIFPYYSVCYPPRPPYPTGVMSRTLAAFLLVEKLSNA